MSAEVLLDRLDRVKKTGRDRWVACCPAHDSKSGASLSIREVDDGRVLVHCFAGCTIDEILGAVDLQIDALFPPRPVGDRAKPERPPIPYRAILKLIADEALLAAVIVSNHAKGAPVTEDDRLRLWTAAGRLASAREFANA